MAVSPEIIYGIILKMVNEHSGPLNAGPLMVPIAKMLRSDTTPEDMAVAMHDLKLAVKEHFAIEEKLVFKAFVHCVPTAESHLLIERLVKEHRTVEVEIDRLEPLATSSNPDECRTFSTDIRKIVTLLQEHYDVELSQIYLIVRNSEDLKRTIVKKAIEFNILPNAGNNPKL